MATIDEIVFKLEGDTRNLDNALKRTESKLNKTTKNMSKDLKRVDKSVLTLGKTFQVLGGVLATIGVARFGREMIKAASDMQQLNTRLITTTGSIKAASEAMGFLRETANRQSVDLLTLANGFNKLLPSVKSGSLSMDELKTILTLTNDNIKALGISAADTDRIFFGLSQVFGAGIVTMENLKQVTEVLPGSLNDIATSMGVMGQTTDETLGSLVKLVSTGKLASKDLKDSLIAAFRANEGAAVAMADTFESAMIRLRNATREAFSEAAQESGFLKVITGGVNDLSLALSDPAFKDGLEFIATTFSAIFQAGLGVIKVLGDLKDGAELIGESLTSSGVQIANFLGLVDDDFKDAVMAEFKDRLFGVADAAKEVEEELNKATPALDALGKKADDVKDKIKKQSLSLAGLVKNLEFEVKISKLSDRQKTIEIAKRKAINAVMKEFKGTQADVTREYQEEIKAIERLTSSLFDLEQAEKDAADQAKELAKQSDIASENIQEGLADAIGDIVSNLDDLEGVGKRVFNNILKFGIDAFSQIAAQQILSAVSGGGGGGGIAGAIGGGGGGLGGLASLGQSIFGGAGGGIIDTIGAGLGFGAGSSVVGAAGPLLPAAGAGALTSASLSAILGVALPIAGIAAAVIPFALSAFKKEGVKASEFASEFGGATTFGAKGKSTEFAENLFAQLSAFTGGIQQAGGAQFQGDIRGGFNSRGGGGFLSIGDTRINFDPENAESAQQAFNELTEILLDTAIIADEEVGEALRNLQLDGLSAAEAIRAVSIASGLLADQFNAQLEQEILKLTDARAFEIKQIEMQTAALKEEAIAIGANVELVEKLGQLRLDQLKEVDTAVNDNSIRDAERQARDRLKEQQAILKEQERAQKAIVKALEASRKEAQRLAEQFARIAFDLKQTALDLQLGSLSALSPEQQLSVSRQAFTDISRRAALGDVEAAQQLPGAASAFLEESRNFNASNAAFKSDFASVQTSLSGAGDVFSRQSSNQAGVVNAINNSINASSSGLNAIVTQLINLTQQGSTQTQTLRDLTIKMSA